MSTEFYLKDYMNTDAIYEIASVSKDNVIKEIASQAFKTGCLLDVQNESILFDKLTERENLGSTAIIPYIAIPHCKVDIINSDMCILIGYSKKGVDFGSHDGKDVKIIFTVLTRKNMPTLHLSALAAISRMISNHSISSNIDKFADKKELQEILNEFKY